MLYSFSILGTNSNYSSAPKKTLNLIDINVPNDKSKNASLTNKPGTIPAKKLVTTSSKNLCNSGKTKLVEELSTKSR